MQRALGDGAITAGHAKALLGTKLGHDRLDHRADALAPLGRAGLGERPAASDERERLLAAMRFVQSEVRYLALALGNGSYVPSPPELVLKRRYGDCKDKTLLALSLLKGLSITRSR